MFPSIYTKWWNSQRGRLHIKGHALVLVLRVFPQAFNKKKKAEEEKKGKKKKVAVLM